MKLICVAVALMCGCPSIMSNNPGTTDQLIAKDTYSLSVRVVGAAGRAAAMSYIYQRASHLCPTGFDVVDANSSAVMTGADAVSAIAGGVAEGQGLQNSYRGPSGSQITAIVRCRVQAEAASQATTTENEPLAPTKPMPIGFKTPDCNRITAIAPLTTLTVQMPDGYNEDDIINAAVQFLATSGETVLTRDSAAHVIVTAPTGGQTIQSTCDINEYRTYSLHIAVVGKTLSIATSCTHSFGWEAHVSGGISIPRNRGESTPCEAATYASKSDAGVASSIAEGVRMMLALRRTP